MTSKGRAWSDLARPENLFTPEDFCQLSARVGLHVRACVYVCDRLKNSSLFFRLCVDFFSSWRHIYGFWFHFYFKIWRPRLGYLLTTAFDRIVLLDMNTYLFTVRRNCWQLLAMAAVFDFLYMANVLILLDRWCVEVDVHGANFIVLPI